MVLKVELENNVWSFYPGQTINGRVVVSKNIWHKIEGLSIRFLGKMEFGCSVSAPIMPPQDALPPSYQQQESLFERITRSKPIQEIILDDKMNLIHSWKVLKPGSHEFPFTYELPEEANLPESIKIDGFRVLYEFVVVLRRPRDDFKVYQTPFYVLNKFEQDCETQVFNNFYSDEIELRREEFVGFCMCCRSGPYGLLFRVPRRKVVVSEDVDFVLEIWNKTRFELDSAKIRLVREYKHKKGLQTKKKEVVSELLGPNVHAGEREVWASYFRVPGNTPPANLVRRETFEINYFLKASIHPLNRPNKAISMKCPLLVIRGPELHFSVPPVGSGSGDINDESDGMMPPPTYVEAMGLDTNSVSPLLE